jgi:hypothetical protein
MAGRQPADEYTSVYGNGNANHYLGIGSILHKGITSVAKSVEIISDSISYITTLRDRCCDVLHVHAPGIKVTIGRTALTREHRMYWITS